jgi:hypothetical protein
MSSGAYEKRRKESQVYRLEPRKAQAPLPIRLTDEALGCTWTP